MFYIAGLVAVLVACGFATNPATHNLAALSLCVGIVLLGLSPHFKFQFNLPELKGQTKMAKSIETFMRYESNIPALKWLKGQIEQNMFVGLNRGEAASINAAIIGVRGYPSMYHLVYRDFCPRQDSQSDYLQMDGSKGLRQNSETEEFSDDELRELVIERIDELLSTLLKKHGQKIDQRTVTIQWETGDKAKTREEIDWSVARLLIKNGLAKRVDASTPPPAPEHKPTPAPAHKPTPPAPAHKPTPAPAHKPTPTPPAPAQDMALQQILEKLDSMESRIARMESVENDDYVDGFIYADYDDFVDEVSGKSAEKVRQILSDMSDAELAHIKEIAKLRFASQRGKRPSWYHQLVMSDRL